MGRGRKGLIEQSRRKPKVVSSETERAEASMSYFYVPNRDEKKLFLPQEAVEIMKNMNPQRFVNFLLPNGDCSVKTSSGNMSGSLLTILDMQIQALSTKISTQNVTFIVRHVIALITWCVISLASFLPGRERKFGDNMPNYVDQYNHSIYIFAIYSKQKAHAFHKKVSHTSKKTWFGQYKYPISANRQIASNWCCSWMWGMAAPDSWKGMCMRLLGAEGKALYGDNPGWTRHGPVHDWGCSNLVHRG